MHKTPLHDQHVQRGAKMVDFHGWAMPLYYTSIVEEHLAVRERVGIFDISHMGQLEVAGRDAARWLDRLLTNDIAQLATGKACYTLMCNEAGGILDDLIVYRLGPERFWVIVNCATRESDLAWLAGHRQGEVTITDYSDAYAILAIQGLASSAVVSRWLEIDPALRRLTWMAIPRGAPGEFVARTGYTGSDGFECFVRADRVVRCWDAVLRTGAAERIQPIGLGARDSLRLEAGYRLYGQDMTVETTPMEAGLEWTVAFDRHEFIGKAALGKLRQAGVAHRLVSFRLREQGIPRVGHRMLREGRPVGVVTSGGFSPLLQQGIGLGRVEVGSAMPATPLAIEIRGRHVSAVVTTVPLQEAHEAMVRKES